MELRYRMAVVTGSGGGLGREIAVALARRGTSVLVADRDQAGAEETVALVRACRVVAWAFQVDLGDAGDVGLLAARARDLGGADVLVDVAGSRVGRLPTPMLLTRAFLADLATRRTPDAPAAAVTIATGAAPYGSPEHAAATAGLIRLTTALSGSETARRARVMAVVPGPLTAPAEVCATVLDLLGNGTAGQVVELAVDPNPTPTTDF